MTSTLGSIGQRAYELLFPEPDNDPDWEGWLRRLFAQYVTAPFAPHHVDFWTWLWAIESDVRPDPFVAVWPRGGAKSQSAELACVALGARRKRKYGLYISETQDQADDHVGNIGALLESKSIEQEYPELAERKVGKYGNSRGWRVNRLRTASGFTIDAVGLDTASRGVKLEEARPDFMVIDDVDGEGDSPLGTEKKIRTLTRALLPAGSSDLAVLAIQNLVHRDSIFSRLVDGRADFLAKRTVSGPIPAVEGLETEQSGVRVLVTGGKPVWEGQNLATCQAQIDDWGYSAFMAEAMHEVRDLQAGMWERDWFRYVHRDAILGYGGGLQSVYVAVDPAGTSHEKSDETGIIVVGKDQNDHGYVLDDYSGRYRPLQWAEKVKEAYDDWEADGVVAEVNMGWDLVEANMRTVDPTLPVEKVHASRGKKLRAGPVSTLYEQGRVSHIGQFPELELQMLSWDPDSGQDSPDRLDAAVHGLTRLLVDTSGAGVGKYRNRVRTKER